MIQRPRMAGRRALYPALWLASAALPAVEGASAQEAPAPAPAPAPTPTGPDRDPPGTIVVIGDRAIIASLKDLAVEREYGEADVGSYAASTIGEVLDAIREENGDEDPAILINGRPVVDPSDIADLPPEAIARIEALPRGAAQRVNGGAGQRAYNVVLKREVRTAIVTASDEFATEGRWNHVRGEFQLTRVRGRNRLNLSLRGGESGYLRESERDFIPRLDDTYYAPAGNVLPSSGGFQVDPALSALAGRVVSTVALPTGNIAPTLASLVPGANTLNPTVRSEFRSLRGASRPVDLSLSGNHELSEQLSLSFNARANWSDNRNLSGLPRARLTIPAGNPSTPFGVPVTLYIEDPARPLTSRNKANGQALSATLNALVGTWRGSLNARFDRREQSSSFASSAALPALKPATNPFGGSLAGQIPIVTNSNRSVSQTASLGLEASGPLAELWAGPVEARVSGSVQWDDYEGNSSSAGLTAFDQRQLAIGAGLTLPLTAREHGFLPVLGDSELAADVRWIDLGAFGTLKNHTLAFNWQPTGWLRVVARTGRDESAISPILLAAPATTVQDVPYFDPFTGDTVEVTAIYGGVTGLLPEDRRTRSLAATATPWKRYNLQLDAEYTVDDLRNQIGALPDPTAAVFAAFPDRFVRDASFTLVLVDARSINLARQRTERLRLGARFTVPLGPPPQRIAGAAGRAASRTPQTKLQVSLSHAELLESTSVIRPGLPVIDLLEGAAVGFGGVQPRGVSSANLALIRGSTGIRADIRRRGPSNLLFGSVADPQRLRFGALTTIDMRFYTDLGEFFPGFAPARGARFTVAFDNLLNRRQLVRNEAGYAPQAYQPIRRDPLGRTVMVELRKSF